MPRWVDFCIHLAYFHTIIATVSVSEEGFPMLLDAFGKQCPMPLVMAKKALDEPILSSWHITVNESAFRFHR